MKNTYFLFFLIFVFFPVSVFSKGIEKKIKNSSFFGAHDKHFSKHDSNIVRIFLDREGNYYPDIFIKDKDIRRNNSSLSQWYKENLGVFNDQCSKYQIVKGDFDQKLSQLNNALAQEIVDSINSKDTGFDIANVSIHGFCKKAYGFRLINRTSSGDNRKLEESLIKSSKKRLFFIEVYWDSKILNLLKMAYRSKGYKIFRDEGKPNALKVGLSLRKVISNIKIPQLNVITHSLGALVASEILFNADPANPLDQKQLLTPQQPHLKLCLIAPAIGSETFNNYLFRANKKIDPEQDNYLVSVVYNDNDVVLNKTIPILFFSIGHHNANSISTTALGCDYRNDLDSLHEKIYPCRLRTFNLSLKKGKPRQCHYLTHCYVNNKVPFSVVAAYLGE
jgi:hypothetical protein